MIGSDTFIIVAFRCSESSTPSARASSISFAKNACSARRLIIEAPPGRPPPTLTPSLSTVVAPSASVNSMRSVPACGDDRRLLAAVEVAAGHVRDVRLRVALQAPIECGCCARVLLHRRGDAAIGVAFAQHRVDGAAEHLARTCALIAFCVVGRGSSG